MEGSAPASLSPTQQASSEVGRVEVPAEAKSIMNLGELQHEVTSDLSFRQMDNLLRCKFFFSMVNSFGDLPLKQDEKVMRLVLRRSFPLWFDAAMLLLLAPIFVRVFVGRDVKLLVGAYLLSICFSLAAGFAYTYLAIHLRSMLLSIERRMVSQEVPSKSAE